MLCRAEVIEHALHVGSLAFKMVRWQARAGAMATQRRQLVSHLGCRLLTSPTPEKLGDGRIDTPSERDEHGCRTATLKARLLERTLSLGQELQWSTASACRTIKLEAPHCRRGLLEKREAVKDLAKACFSILNREPNRWREAWRN